MNISPISKRLVRRRRDLGYGQAFDNACKSLQNFSSAVPAIVADRIIDVAKNGERDPDRLLSKH